ncbi:MAG: HAD-IA family hydrolase [Myxococcota bacterium]|nr:HAD-IA family hydrolase [Myxococcota bacterium]MEC8423381.1 HAD-IA family hydrolase [Myxococcota bacterium]
MELHRCHHWIFDMDGTLTVPMHDFAWLRAELGVPAGVDILVDVDARPPAAAAAARRVIHDWELDIADRARPQPDALRLLEALAAADARIGVLTRNTQEGAQRTLRAAGLEHFFAPEAVLGRDDAPPKPDPAGILHLLSLWGAVAPDAVMVGDWIYDTEAGRNAGTATVLVDRTGDVPASDSIDLLVKSLDAVPRPRQT